MSLKQSKKNLRGLARASRAGARRSAGDIGDRLASHFMSWASRSLPFDRRVSGYYPIGDEANVMPLLGSLAEREQPLCLPLTIGRGEPLIFRSWSPGDPLVPGARDIPEPPNSAPVVRPEILLIPLLAFDLTGGRLGYGAGHYDRTIAEITDHSPIKIGIAYAGQLVDSVPMEPTDQRLDAVLTENGLAWIEAGRPAMGLA